MFGSWCSICVGNEKKKKEEFSRFSILLNIYYDYELNYSQKTVTDAR